jgi:hypothetical protein
MNRIFGLFLLALAFLAPDQVHAASRFWVGGTGTWDAADTTHWSTTSGGAGGASVPGTSDDVIIDGHASGLNGGTITVNANFSVLSISSGAMIGTLDFGTNNNSPTIGNNGWNNSGTATRTINLGSGTFTFTMTNISVIVWGTTTNLTLGANTATFLLTGNTANGRTIALSSASLSNLPSISIATNTNTGTWDISGAGTQTIPTLTIAAPNQITWSTSAITLTNLVFSGSSSSALIFLTTGAINTQRTLPLTNSTSGSWLALRGINPTTGTITATDSFDLELNGANAIITPPSGGGSGGGRIIGG